MRVHLADPEVEWQHFVQRRVANVHDDRIHAAKDERRSAPPPFHVHKQVAHGQQERGHSRCDHHKGEGPKRKEK